MNTMSSADQLFLSRVKTWAQEPGTTTYLVGPQNGALDLNIETGAFSARAERMNPALKAAILELPNAFDHQMTEEQVREALKAAK